MKAAWTPSPIAAIMMPSTAEERIARHDLAILEGAGLALVGVDREVARARFARRHERPLKPGGEAGAAAAAEVGVLHQRRRGPWAPSRPPWAPPCSRRAARYSSSVSHFSSPRGSRYPSTPSGMCEMTGAGRARRRAPRPAIQAARGQLRRYALQVRIAVHLHDRRGRARAETFDFRRSRSGRRVSRCPT